MYLSTYTAKGLLVFLHVEQLLLEIWVHFAQALQRTDPKSLCQGASFIRHDAHCLLEYLPIQSSESQLRWGPNEP